METLKKLFESLYDINKYGIKPKIDPDNGSYYSIPNREDTDLIGYRSNGTILISEIKTYLN